MLDPQVLAAVTRQIHQQFPEVAGRAPKLRRQQPPPGQDGPLYLLTFQGQGALPGGKTIPRLVRVALDAHGDILKITTSR